MSGAPSYIDDIQLDELGINITKEEKDRAVISLQWLTE